MHTYIPLSVFGVVSLWSGVVEMLVALRHRNVVATQVVQARGSPRLRRFCLVSATSGCSSENTQRSDGSVAIHPCFHIRESASSSASRSGMVAFSLCTWSAILLLMPLSFVVIRWYAHRKR